MREFMNRTTSTGINNYYPDVMSLFKESINDGYINGHMEETILRIEQKLEDLFNEITSLNTILENHHAR